jgi:hypothetical protein
MGTKEHNSTTCQKSSCLICLREQREKIIAPCVKVQFSTKGSKDEFKTEIIEKPCSRIDGELCGACLSPDAKWRSGKCNLATHLHYEPKKGESYAFVTPITLEAIDPRKKTKMLNPIKYSKSL